MRSQSTLVFVRLISLPLERRLPALLRGEDRPADAAERRTLAELCYLRRLYAASARFADEFLRDDPDLPRSPASIPRYNAACAAALAAAGQGRDAPPTSRKRRPDSVGRPSAG
jgi:hypothetical protein